MNEDQEFRRLLWFLLGGSRGGENRVKILNAIKFRPSNLNQLARLIGVDYRSVQHHMGVLLKNNLVQSSGQRYGVVYSVHPWLEHHYRIFGEVCEQLGYSATLTVRGIPEEKNDFLQKAIRTEAMPQIARAGDGPRQ